MLDGSDAIADWAILNALVNTASGATWVSIHHGGGVGWAARCTPARSASPTAPPWRPRRSSGSLTNDPGMGVIRHVDAGYDRAVEVAHERGAGADGRGLTSAGLPG